jgi:glycerophosphoryl diester phosphodiesterase
MADSNSINSLQIIAHRGASFIAPENTQASFNLAYKMGAPAAECDVYLTKDNQIMIMHDKSAKRTGGVDVNMAQTDSNTLSKIDVGSWKSPDYKGEKIPFLKDVIQSIPQGKKLVIEVKSGVEILPYLHELITKSNKADQLEIISFDFDVAAGCKKLMPDIPVYWLIWSDNDKQTKQPIPHSFENIDKAKSVELDGIDASYAGVTKEFTDKIHSAGMKLYVWTVDDINDAQKLKNIGVDGITTNKPDIMLKHFKL